MMFGSNTLGNGWVLPADDAAITAAMELLRSGQIVAIPTETVYGLAADASNADAVAKIKAGADVVQIYTGLIYKGPALVKEAALAIRDHT